MFMNCFGTGSGFQEANNSVLAHKLIFQLVGIRQTKVTQLCRSARLMDWQLALIVFELLNSAGVGESYPLHTGGSSLH